MATRGLLLESSVLGESASVEKLLFRLGYSNLHVVRTRASHSHFAITIPALDLFHRKLSWVSPNPCLATVLTALITNSITILESIGSTMQK
jgi:hypothetical protein